MGFGADGRPFWWSYRATFGQISSLTPHSGTGGARSRWIAVSILLNRAPLTATSASWKVIARACRTTLAVSAFYAEDEITIEGDTSSYGFEGGSGMPVTTHFCDKCGCRIYGKADSFPGMVTMVLGAFDEPHSFKPKGEIYTNYKLKWLKDDGCIQESFEEAAVEERLMSLLTGLEDR